VLEWVTLIKPLAACAEKAASTPAIKAMAQIFFLVFT
jgi:hypothetical protein